MAYRFLLEAPESLASEASLAVDGTPDAQVVLVRNSHGLGIDDESVDLTVAAHSLQVIDWLYDWFDVLGASRPDIRLVLHSGDRLSLEEVDRGAMVAAIRRDQPWVERSIPHVGDHEEPFNPEPVGGAPEVNAIDGAGGNAPDRLVADYLVTGNEVAIPEMTQRVHLRAVNHIAIWVNEPAKAERFYGDYLNMEITGRARRGDGGALELLEPDFDWTDAIRDGVQPDITYLSNGAVSLLLMNAGRGARLERGLLDHISVAVDGSTFAMLKGEALVRSLVLLGTSESGFRFRDPFGLTWEILLMAPQLNPVRAHA